MLLVGLIVAMIVGIVAWVGGDGSECVRCPRWRSKPADLLAPI
jgi:hypothetical protein